MAGPEPRLRVREAGAGPPLLFLHGWTMSGAAFADQMARLSDRFHCLAPDLPGHGRSPCPAPTVAGAADAVAALLAARGLTGATLVGWSLGAAVGWALLDRHGAGRVARMVSVDMSPRLLNGPGWRLGLRGHDEAACRATTARFRADWRAAAPAIARSMFATPAGAPGMTREQATAQVLDNDPAAMVSMWASLLEADARALVARHPVPLLAAHGAHSRVYPAETAAWLVETAPDARPARFARSGHAPHLEEPEAFARAVADFAGG